MQLIGVDAFARLRLLERGSENIVQGVELLVVEVVIAGSEHDIELGAIGKAGRRLADQTTVLDPHSEWLGHLAIIADHSGARILGRTRRRGAVDPAPRSEGPPRLIVPRCDDGAQRSARSGSNGHARQRLSSAKRRLYGHALPGKGAPASALRPRVVGQGSPGLSTAQPQVRLASRVHGVPVLAADSRR